MSQAHVLSTTSFDLRTTLLSGQVFRYTEIDDAFLLRIRDRIIRLRQAGNRLEFHGCDPEFLRHFFHLDLDLAAVQAALGREPRLRGAVQAFPGLRVMRQDPWECLVSFILSAFSNIPRIRKNIEAICRLYGRPITLDGHKSFSFPRPGTLRDEGELRRAGTGYRARHLVALNGLTPSLGLERLRSLPYEEAKGSLMELPGVGEKVADCVLLFSLGFTQAFPVDVWIKRVMQEYYFKGRTVPDRAIRQHAADHFGPYAGYAQQYLFHYARTKK
ncbi:MAG: hypothetical protein HYU36_00360 [Planctomycetes bacterium]|nr:hypothetical protein [Planctomycetota bacterium]